MINETMNAELGLSEQVAEFHMRRHNVLASNLANVETPGFRPKDLVFGDELSRVVGVVTDSAHLELGSVENEKVVDLGDSDPGGDGNRVTLDDAMTRITANRLRHDTVVEILHRRVALLRYAAAGGA